MTSLKEMDSLAPAGADRHDAGVISLDVAGKTYEVSNVEHWVDGAVHCFASTEFDCQAEGPDEQAAVRAFVETAEDLLRYLDDVYDAGRATEHELDVLVKLSRRFLDIHDAIEREQERRRLADFFRRPANMRDAVRWHARRPAPADSRELSRA